MADTTISNDAEQSFLRGTGNLLQKIDRARLELLDLSTRNRLIHTPRGGRAKTVEVVGELAESMYETLVLKGKRFTFEAGRADPTGDPDAELDAALAEEAAEAAVAEELTGQPEVELDESGRVAAHWDDRLQTRLTSTGLQRRLSDLYIDSRTLEEEQGVNSLFLAVGYLRWRAASRPNEDRFAPLVLIPVNLERNNAGEKFHLKWSGEDIEANLSLQLHLEREFGLKLPPIVEFESLDIDAYLASVSEMVANTPNWGVERDDAVLGLFSFAKFMMYRDLDPGQWESVGGFERRTALRGVVSDGFPGTSLTQDDAKIDPIVPPADMLHVVDCDSSQALVVHDVRRGTHILVQGPPGTGKSQTIANIIAAAVADKKRVLFVAEKMAALEVVKRRLDQAHIGDACLELHSNKANKRAFLAELQRTWSLGAPQLPRDGAVVEQLTEVRDDLNAHAERLHRRFTPPELSPFEVLGHLVRLRREGHITRRIPLDDAITWPPHVMEARETLLRDLLVRIDFMGLPVAHAWVGVGIRGLSPNDRDRALRDVAAHGVALDAWRERAAVLSAELDLVPPTRFTDIAAVQDRAQRIVAQPPIGPVAIMDRVWDTPNSVAATLFTLREAQATHAHASAITDPQALHENWTATQETLASLVSDFSLDQELSELARADRDLERAIPDLHRLAQLFGEGGSLTLDSALRLASIGERAATVPDIGRDSLVASIWDRGVDSLEESIEAVERVQFARSKVQYAFRDTAWERDLESARAILATLGGSWMRWFNASWRQANRQVRALLTNPKLPADEMLLALDELLVGQAARGKVAERDSQATEAFGRAWQRERSDVAFLRGVASWMRSLRPLGSGVRERLAEVGDRELASELALRVRPLLEAAQTTLHTLSERLLSAGKQPWGEETVLRRVPLPQVKNLTSRAVTAHEQLRLLAEYEHMQVDAALAALARIAEAQAALAALDAQSQQGKAAFGPLWTGLSSDLTFLEAASAWMRENSGLRALAARTLDCESLLARADALEAEGRDVGGRLAALFGSLQFEGDEAHNYDLGSLSSRLERWRSQPEGLPQWLSYIDRAKEAEAKGMAAFIDALFDGNLPTDAAVGTFQLAYYEAVWEQMARAEPLLRTVDAQHQSQKVTQFGELDLARMALARAQIAKVHHAHIPQRGGAVGPTRTLLGEMAKSRKHLPIRKVMEGCAPVVQALKPVFMMSPLSVAQFLPPTALEFDMLVVDEASQVQPVDALGAIARAKQLVIMSDERQLPPTRFFSKVMGEGESEEGDEAQAGDVESILGLCRARGLPERMLRWHYRSRHESLIAVSNREFYSNQLFIVPSPYTSAANLGLRLTHLTDAIYDRGGARDNPIEAQAVAEAVIDHAKRTPHLSLGVATFSTAQRRAIWDRLELLRRQHPETEGFFGAHASEPFFVKSLENIQGDERDVIYISVGYGRDAFGNLTMNFGPLSSKGGERRLNVLISRAKSRCEVFSSITDEDIDTERAKGAGVMAFKLFLRYARTGQLDHRGEESNRNAQVFSDEIAKALKSRGYETRQSVGVAGLFVDLAVTDPDQPGCYVLGIECDGVWYRDARSSRDRERLREAALRDKGWEIYRVWSGAWFQRPQAELDRLVETIETAKLQIRTRTEGMAAPRRAVPVEIEAIDRGDVIEIGLGELDDTSWVESYEEAHFSVPNRRIELHEVPPSEMAEIVRKVVEAEGPIHRMEVVARVRSLWGLQRAGGRIQSAVEAGIAYSIGLREITRTHECFVSIPGQSIRIRNRGEVASLTLRRPDFLPPQEIDAAIRYIVQANMGANAEELVLHVARALGYRSTSAQLRAVIEDRVNVLLVEGALSENNDLLTAPHIS